MQSKLSKLFLNIFLLVLLASAVFGAPNQFLVIAPGMSLSNAGSPGYTGTPVPQTAGIPFNVTIVTIENTNYLATNSLASNVSMTSSDNTSVITPHNPFTLTDTYTSASYTASNCMKIISVVFGPTASGSVGLYATNQPNSNGVTNGSVTITSQVLSKFVIGNATGAKTAGTPFAVSVTALDNSNNIVTSFNGTANITANYPVTGSISLGTLTFTNGVCNSALAANVTLYAASAANVTLTISYSNSYGVSASGTSAGFAVNAATLSQLLMIGPGQTAAFGLNSGNGRTGSSEIITQQTAGTPFYVTVYAVDAYWNTVTTSTSVAITSTDASAVFTAQTAQPFTNGKAIFKCEMRTVVPGAQTITAVSTTNSSIVDTDMAVVNPGSAHHFTFVPGTIISTKAGSQFEVDVCARDAFDNTVTSYTGSPQLSIFVSGDVNALTINSYWVSDSGDNTIIFDSSSNGISSGLLTIYKAVSTGYISLSDGIINAKTQLPISISPNNFKRLLLVPSGETRDAGNVSSGIIQTYGKTGSADDMVVGDPTKASMEVYSTDLYGNIINTISDTIRIESTDNSATVNNISVPTTISLVSGEGTFSFMFGTSGSMVVGVNDSSTSGITYNSVTIKVTAGDVSYFEIANMPTSTYIAGMAFSPIIRARDKNGNIKTNYSGIVYLSSNTDWTLPNETTMNVTGTNAGVFGYKWAVTFTAGTGIRSDLTCHFYRAATFTARIFASDNYSDTPDTVTPTGHTGLSSTVMVTAGSVSKLQVLVPGLTSRPGTTDGIDGTVAGQQITTAFACTVTVVDQYWNVLTGDTGTDIILETTDDANASLGADNPPTTSAPQHVYSALGAKIFYVSESVQSSSFKIYAAFSSVPTTHYYSEPIQIYNVGKLTITGLSGVTLDTAHTVGVPITISITAYDAAGVPLTDFDGTVYLKANNDYSNSIQCITPVKSISFTKGICVMDVTLFRAGNSMPASESGKVQIEAVYGSKTYGSDTFNLWPQAPEKALIIFEGMTYTPGRYAYDPGNVGYTGSPNKEIAGHGATMSIYLVDQYFNRCVTYPDVSCVITSTDTQATMGGTSLTGGITVTLANGGYYSTTDMELKTVLNAQNKPYQTITAAPSGFTDFTTPDIYVMHDTYSKFSILGPSTSVIAGVPFKITIQAMDAYNNLCDNTNSGSSFNHDVSLSTGRKTIWPISYPLSNGLAVADIQLFEALTNTQITATYSPATGTSGSINTVANVFKRLLVLAPDMIQSRGIYSGVSPTVFLMYNPENLPFTSSTAYVNDTNHTPLGRSFAIFSCDAYGNVTRTTALQGMTVTVATNDKYAVPVTNTSIDWQAGTGTANVIFHTAMSGVSVTANISDPSIEPFTTLTFTTVAGTAYGYQILVPGITAVPGSGFLSPYGVYYKWYNGVSGNPSTEISGSPFPVTAYVSDIFGNTTPMSTSDLVQFSTVGSTISGSVPDPTSGFSASLVDGYVSFTAKLVTTQESTNIEMDIGDQTNIGLTGMLLYKTLSIPVILSDQSHFRISIRESPASAWVNNLDGTEEIHVKAAPSKFGIMVNVLDNVNNNPIYTASNTFKIDAVSESDINTVLDGNLAVKSGNVYQGSFPADLTQDIESFTNATGSTLMRLKVSETGSASALTPVASAKIEVGANTTNALFTAYPTYANSRADSLDPIIGHLVDVNENSVSGVTIYFSMLKGSGTLGASSITATATTDSAGNATVPFYGGLINEANLISAYYAGNQTYKYVTVNVSLAEPNAGQVSNYPNPFRAGQESTHIAYLLEENSDVKIRIYTLFGDLVLSKDIRSGETGAITGIVNVFDWDGKNGKGEVVGNGGYICSVEAVFQGAKKKVIRKIAVAK